MKLPVISGKEAVKAFEKLGYAHVKQQGGSHPCGFVRVWNKLKNHTTPTVKFIYY